MKKSIITILTLLCTVILTAQPSNSVANQPQSAPMQQVNPSQDAIDAGYTKQEVMIEMRDGVKIYTAIYTPDPSLGPRPVIMQRTPYGCSPYGESFSRSLRPGNAYFDNRYIFVFQDVRGQNHSEGVFVQALPYNVKANHGPANGNREFDDATDTYDSIDWIVNNVNTNGCVGIKGTSYPGFYATMGALCGHPAMKAASPQAPTTDWFYGDDIHHNGAFFLVDLYNFGTSFFLDREANLENPYRSPARIEGNAYDYFLNLKTTWNALMTIADEITLRDKYTMWEDIIDHPTYDEYWTAIDPIYHFKDVKPAVMVVGGMYDGEDCWGAVNTYKEMVKRSPSTETYFVYGPWQHGSWSSRGFKGFGGYTFGDGIGDWYNDDVEYKFFSYYLEGKGEKPAKINVIPAFWDNNGAWKAIHPAEWPMKSMTPKKLYLNAGGRASLISADRKKSFNTIISDPSNPVPYTEKSKMRGKTYVIEDQRFLEGRDDILNYRMDAVSDTMLLAGPVKADIWLSSTSEDLDLVVKLIDVNPDGAQMTIKSDVFRCRYRDGFDKNSFLKPGKKTEIKFDLTDVAYYLLPGHSILVQIQTSWFPLVDLNPQSAVDNIYKAQPSDYKKAEVRILSGGRYPSHIELPVCPL